MANMFEKCQRLVPALTSILGSAEFVKTTEAVRAQFARDEGHFEPKLPDLVVQPSSTEQVAAIVGLANKHSVPVIPFGTGTGLEGGVLAIKGGICIDLHRMDRILEVNEEDFDCTVQPGVTKKVLNNHLRDSGLWFTVDPGSDASICGMVATGASGTTSVRYGTMKENVKSLEVVLPDGRILHTRGKGRRPWKSSAGYNLTELFVGSEGTLGIVTAACVQLHARPAATGLAVCSFNSVHEAVKTVVCIRQMAIPVARLEFLDDRQMEACLALYPEIQLPSAFTIFMEFHGGSSGEVKGQTDLVEELCVTNGGLNFRCTDDPEKGALLWKARHRAYYATLSRRPGGRGFVTDVCVPISELPGVLEETRAMLDRSGLYATIVGHVGDGNFHCIFPVVEENKAEMEAVWTVSNQIVKKALSVGGTCTGEHGIGMGKMEHLKEEMGPVVWEVMRSLKEHFDPQNIMNPGKIFSETGEKPIPKCQNDLHC